MNPAYKQTVGGAIFEFVQSLVESFAPKVTGMLIELPVPEIQKYMVNFDHFLLRVFQARKLLESEIEASYKTASTMPPTSSENSEPPKESEETKEG